MRRAQDRARSARFRKNGARSATIESCALGALKLASEARNENVPEKRADFFAYHSELIRKTFCITFDEKRSKKLIGLNPVQSEASIRMNPNQSEISHT